MVRDLIGVVIAFVMFCIALAFADGEYKKNAVVVDTFNDVVVVEMVNNGEVFEFYGIGFEKGDKVLLKMHDCETIGNEDDVILDCEKCTNLS